MDELRAEMRAAAAIALKDLISLSRYPWSMWAMVFNPLYQGILPAFLFGAAFAIGGRSVGLGATVGTENLSGFVFLGGVVSSLVAVAFWITAFSFRTEMEMGTLEPTWLTPTRRDTLLLGRLAGGLVVLVASQAVLLVLGFAFFGLRFDAAIVYALPALAISVVGMVGTAYLLAAAVFLIKEANFFVDTTNFLYSTMSGVMFPITLLPLVLQPIALLLPTTYATDILRQQAIGARPMFAAPLEYAGLIATTLLILPLGRWAFARAERSMRVRGTLGQY